MYYDNRLGTAVSGAAGPVIAGGHLDLFQHHWNGSTDDIDSAPPGSTDFMAGPTQFVDGGTMPGTSGVSGFIVGATLAEPYAFLLLGSGLIGIGLWGRRRHGD